MTHLLDAPDQPEYFAALLDCIESAKSITANTAKLALTKGFYDGWKKGFFYPHRGFDDVFSGSIKRYLQDHTPSAEELRGYASGWTSAWGMHRDAPPVGAPYDVMWRECEHMGRTDIINAPETWELRGKMLLRP